MSQKSKDTWLYFSASTTGAALVFMLLSSWSVSTRVMVGVAGVGLALLGLSQWRKKTRYEHPHEETVDTASILVDAESRAEILFGPVVPAVNPKLIMSAHGRPVFVEDAWHEDVSVLASPRAVVHWRRGVVYSGVVDSKRTLKILLHNQGFTPAMVHAKLVIPKDEGRGR